MKLKWFDMSNCKGVDQDILRRNMSDKLQRPCWELDDFLMLFMNRTMEKANSA